MDSPKYPAQYEEETDGDLATATRPQASEDAALAGKSEDVKADFSHSPEVGEKHTYHENRL